MRAVLQRVTHASVVVDGQVVGKLDEPGLVVLVGITHDERSVAEDGAPVLVISQFTLYGDARKGRRPTWAAAAPGEVSEPLYDALCAALEDLGTRVERGVFGAQMEVSLVNDGPFTVSLDAPGP